MEHYELIDNTEANQYEFHVGTHIAKIEYIKTKNGGNLSYPYRSTRCLEGQGIAASLPRRY